MTRYQFLAVNSQNVKTKKKRQWNYGTHVDDEFQGGFRVTEKIQGHKH